MEKYSKELDSSVSMVMQMLCIQGIMESTVGCLVDAPAPSPTVKSSIQPTPTR